MHWFKSKNIQALADKAIAASLVQNNPEYNKISMFIIFEYLCACILELLLITELILQLPHTQ